MKNKKQHNADYSSCRTKTDLLIRIALFFLLCIFVVVIWKANQPVVYLDVSQYGQYTGTGSNAFVREYIISFFPEQIEEYFSNVKYVYKAAGKNNYDFEAYLEFSITDTNIFNRYVGEIAPEDSWETFPFNSDYQAYMIENCLDVRESSIPDHRSEVDYPIEGARVRVVLCNAENQTIVFWALGVYDGGGVGTDFLNTFFDRFDIDPLAYEQAADSPHGRDPFAIE